MGSKDYERMAFEQLRAAARAPSSEAQEEHERQAYLLALKAHEAESVTDSPLHASLL